MDGVELPSKFNEIVIDDLTKGFDSSLRPTALEDGQMADVLNLIFDKARLRVDTGYTPFMESVRGVPRVSWQFYKTNGTSELLLFTNETLYKEANGEWQYVAEGDGSGSAISTTTTAGASAGATTVTVADITGFSDADYIGIILDDGSQHKTTVNGAPAGSDIDFDDAIPVGRSVANGATVLKAVDLAGSDDEAVSLLTMPSHNWVAFTNGVDNVKYYDGTLFEDIHNLPSSGNTQCKGLALYYNHLMLIHTIEGGTAYPQRIRWPDTADPENWSTGNASYADLLDTEDFLVAGVILGPYLIAYKERSIVRFEYVGAADKLFDYDTVVTGEGAIAHDAIVDLGDSHVLFGNANIYKYTGGFDLEPIGDQIYFKLFGVGGDMNPGYKHRSIALYLEELDETWILYPTGDDEYPSHVARYRNDLESWTIRKFNRYISGYGFYQLDSSKSWIEMTGTWAEQNLQWNSNTLLANAPTTLLCSDDMQVYEYDYQAVGEDDEDISWFFTTKMFHHPHFILRTDLLEFKAKGSSVTIYYRKEEDDEWQLWGTKSLAASRAKYRSHKQVTAERIQFKFEGSGGGFSMDWLAFSYQIESE